MWFTRTRTNMSYTNAQVWFTQKENINSCFITFWLWLDEMTKTNTFLECDTYTHLWARYHLLVDYFLLRSSYCLRRRGFSMNKKLLDIKWKKYIWPIICRPVTSSRKLACCLMHNKQTYPLIWSYLTLTNVEISNTPKITYIPIKLHISGSWRMVMSKVIMFRVMYMSRNIA